MNIVGNVIKTREGVVPVVYMSTGTAGNKSASSAQRLTFLKRKGLNNVFIVSAKSKYAHAIKWKFALIQILKRKICIHQRWNTSTTYLFFPILAIKSESSIEGILFQRSLSFVKRRLTLGPPRSQPIYRVHNSHGTKSKTKSSTSQVISRFG